MLDVGETAPEFQLPGADEGGITQYHLSEFTEAGGVVVLFYPFDFSPVCTKELCEFRDSEWLTFTSDLDVIGISTDSAYAHRQVVRESDIPFPLLSDHDGSVSEQYDVLYEGLEGHPRVSKRAVFLVDDSRTIRYGWEADEWLTDPDLGEVYDAVGDVDSLAVA